MPIIKSSIEYDGNSGGFLIEGRNFSFILDNGKLRYFSSSEEELIRMIHIAVRDENWMTINPQISDLQIDTIKNKSFVFYSADFVSGNIDFTVRVKIEIQDDEMTFSFTGRANKTFLRNRIGICVLHPLNTCTNIICEVERPDGTGYSGNFPELISPHQPFTDIQAMHWSTPGNSMLKLFFKGDVFETEDQRNWGDASFKTYSTPLEIPIPVLVEKATEINQSVELKFIIPDNKKTSPAYFRIEKDLFDFPQIGFSIPSEIPHTQATSVCLQNLNPDYLSIESGFENKWQQELLKKLTLAKSLEKEVELAIIVKDLPYPPDDFFPVVSSSGVQVRNFLLIAWSDKIIKEEVYKNYSTALLRNFGSIPIGCGTRFHFSEINRESLPEKNPSFISFPLNPQVHADDSETIIENLQAFPDITNSARHLYPEIPLHINRLTLRYPFNPDPAGTDRYKRADGLPWTVDHRQWQFFYAQWILPALSKLKDAEQVTICDTHGLNGLFSEQAVAGIPESENAVWLFPAYLIFFEMAHFKPTQIYKTVSGNPFRVEGLFLKNDAGEYLLMLSNFCSVPLEIKVSGISDFKSECGEKFLSAENLTEALGKPGSWVGNHYNPCSSNMAEMVKLAANSCQLYRWK